MKIVCATELAFPKEAFGALGEAVIVPGRTISAADARDAGLLAIRSTTRVGKELLEGSSVRFVGTATIGTDHMDTGYLDRAGIKWCYAPGCNANSVSEYVVAALLCLSQRSGFRLDGKTIGVIGVGNVGSLVAAKAGALGMRVLQNDPPRQRAEGRETDFVSLDRVLRESDIVTLHVPLTRSGKDPTFHMANRDFYARMKKGTIFFNTARGPVAETKALLGAIDRGIATHAVIDTWEHEPCYIPELLDRADIATPHIAGYSFEGKAMGTVMVYREACRFLGIEPTWRPDRFMPPPSVPEIRLDAKDRPDEAVLWEAVRLVYDIEADDRRLRDAASPDGTKRAAAFDQLRRNYPVRREFRFTRLLLSNAGPGLLSKAAALGFAS